MVAFIVIGVLIALAVWFFVSQEFYVVAKEKGYPQEKYLWITFFLGIVGVLLIVALPDRGKMTSIESYPDVSETEIADTVNESSALNSKKKTSETVEEKKDPDYTSMSDLEKLEYYKQLLDRGKISKKQFVQIRKTIIGQ